MQIAYTAHTETCTLLLDAGGICRSVLAASSEAVANGRGGRPTRIPASAEKCIGAQYVASMDVREPGGMVPMPKPGAQMLFARTEENGRITLVRSAPVVRFETSAPATESGVHTRPSARPNVKFQGDDEPTIRRSVPPSLPPRSSGVVPVASPAGRVTAIPPPPRLPRVHSPDSETRPVQAVRLPPAPTSAPTLPRASKSPSPKRPTLARVSAPSATDWELETRPFRRAAR